MKNKITLAITFSIVFLAACKKRSTDPGYTNFKILTVTVKDMPFQDVNGEEWDLLDGPDVFFNMEDENNTVLFNGSGQKFEDVVRSDLPIGWDLLNAYEINNLGVAHYVTIYDYDLLSQNDRIGYIGFTMNEHKIGYPRTITKRSGSLAVTITGEWY